MQEIGPTFGETVANSALIAIIASLLVISIYIALRFEWKYAVPVLIALMHDILITAGVYSLVGREVTTSTVAALLTILGFSLYDTIIVFDRIRENVPRMPSAAFSQIVNRSMSEVHRALAGHQLLHRAAGPRPVPVRRRDAAGLRLRAARRHALGHLLLGVHRRPGAHALEGARAGLPGAPAPDPRGARLRARLRGRRRRGAPGRRRARARAAGAPAPLAQDPSQGVSREEFDDMVRQPRRSSPTPRRRRAAAPAAAARGAGAAARAAGARAAAPEGAPGGEPPGSARGRATGRRQPPPGEDGPEARRSRATAGTGGRADGRARVGHDRPRHLALHDLPAGPLLGRDRRRVRRRADRLRALRAG